MVVHDSVAGITATTACLLSSRIVMHDILRMQPMQSYETDAFHLTFASLLALSFLAITAMFTCRGTP